MLHTLLAWAAVIALVAAAVPTAILLARMLNLPSRALIALLTLAFSTGGLSLVVLWEGLLKVPLSFGTVVIPYLIGMLPGVMIWRRSMPHKLPEAARPMSRHSLLVIGPITLVAGAVLFNAVYYPLYRDDTLGIYRPAALPMYYQGRLDPLIGADSLYRTYPVLIPSMYALGYMASGWENDYLAKLLPVLLSLGCLPAAYLLGMTVSGKRIGGLTAAVLLAITPAFGRWGSTGYVDLPMAFFYTASVYFALRLWESRSTLDALLAGVLLGLAANTKNAALLAVPLLAIWLAYAVVMQRIRVKQAVISLAAVAGIGAPFYIRNLLGAGFLIPATAWTDQAQHTLSTLFALATRPENFGITGLFGMVGWAFAITRLRYPGERAPALALLGFTVPFYAAWWLFVSYDPRFLLLFLPILCAGGAWALVETDAVLPARTQRLLRRAALAAVITLALITAFLSVEYKRELLHDPFMSHEAKLALVGRTSSPP